MPFVKQKDVSLRWEIFWSLRYYRNETDHDVTLCEKMCGVRHIVVTSYRPRLQWYLTFVDSYRRIGSSYNCLFWRVSLSGTPEQGCITGALPPWPLKGGQPGYRCPHIPVS